MAFLEDAICCDSSLPEMITIFRANLDVFMWIRQGVVFRVRKKRISLSQSRSEGSWDKSALRGRAQVAMVEVLQAEREERPDVQVGGSGAFCVLMGWVLFDVLLLQQIAKLYSGNRHSY